MVTLSRWFVWQIDSVVCFIGNALALQTTDGHIHIFECETNRIKASFKVNTYLPLPWTAASDGNTICIGICQPNIIQDQRSMRQVMHTVGWRSMMHRVAISLGVSRHHSVYQGLCTPVQFLCSICTLLHLLGVDTSADLNATWKVCTEATQALTLRKSTEYLP